MTSAQNQIEVAERNRRKLAERNELKRREMRALEWRGFWMGLGLGILAGFFVYIMMLALLCLFVKGMMDGIKD